MRIGGEVSGACKAELDGVALWVLCGAVIDLKPYES